MERDIPPPPRERNGERDEWRGKRKLRNKCARGKTHRTAELAMLLTFAINLFTVPFPSSLSLFPPPLPLPAFSLVVHLARARRPSTSRPPPTPASPSTPVRSPVPRYR